MAVLFRKLLGIGKLPDDMRAQVEAEGVIYTAEFISVIMRFTGAVPGRKSRGLVRGYVGALALTNHRLLATMSSVSNKAGRSVDQPWTTPPGGMGTATCDGAGLTLDLPDISVVDPQFCGSITMHYQDPLSEQILTQLPTRTVAFDVPPAWVYGAVGVAKGGGTP